MTVFSLHRRCMLDRCRRKKARADSVRRRLNPKPKALNPKPAVSLRFGLDYGSSVDGIPKRDQ